MAIFIVMGVAGCGKSTIARKLAEASSGIFLDGDDFHPPENKEKMATGIPLTDADRGPWLDRLNAELSARSAFGKPIFLACSALKETYRQRLAAGLPGVKIVYLKGSFELIHSRMLQRTHHFMPVTLLQSQFADLEEPQGAIILDISRTEEQLVEDFRQLAPG